MSMTGSHPLQLRRCLRSTTILVCITSVALSGALSGCAGMGTGASYAVAADDLCAAERTQLKSFQDYFFQSMIQGAATGALLGGLSGLLIGGDAKGALIGAGAGAVVGGATGYFAAKQRATSDPVALTQAVYTDIYNENAQLDSVSAAFVRLRDCRYQGAKLIKADFAAGRMSKADAQAKLGVMRQRFQEDIVFAEGLNSKIAERGSQYDGASNEVMKFDPTARDRALQREAAERAAQEQAAPRYVANETLRMHATPAANGAAVGSVARGQTVVLIGSPGGEWANVRLTSGQSGYVAMRLLRPAGTAAPVRVAAVAPPPKDASGVVQLTETNQLKRKALADDVASAKVAAASTFDLEGAISRAGERDAAPA